MSRGQYKQAAASGKCPYCQDTRAPGRKLCAACLEYRAERAKEQYRARHPDALVTCSYCQELGHNRRTCEAFAEAVRQHGEVAAVLHQRALQPLVEKNPYGWEVQAHKRAKVRQVFETIATLPPSKASAELARKAAKAALKGLV